MKYPYLIIFALMSTSSFSQEFDKAKLDSYFESLDKNSKFMGSVAVSKNGNVLFAKSVGYGDVEKGIPASINTKYRIGSVSKTFTAALTFLAIEKGMIKLDQTLDKFFPAIPNAKKIKISELLYHRSGIHDFTSDEDYIDWLSQPKSRKEMVEIITHGGSDFVPDSEAQYSNSNYLLLTYILEDIYKKPYGEILNDKILVPLGLTNTYFIENPTSSSNECSSYNYESGWKKQSNTHMSIPMGAGGIISTPMDLIKFGDALFQGKIVSLESLEQMKTIRDNYGMGLFKVPFNDKYGFGHTGGIDGFSALFFYFPEDKISFALTTNGNNYNDNEIAIAVLSAVYNKPYTIPEFTTYTSTSEELQTLPGVYSSNDIPLKITITREENVLHAQATGQPAFALEAAGPTTFKFDPAGLTLEFNPADNTMLLKQRGATFAYKKD